MSKQWFVGLTKDQQELKAAADLRAQGYAVYLPKLYTRRQEGRKIEARADLRFTGYIFIAFDLALDEHGPISNTRGMDSPDGDDGSALICSGGIPVALPAGIIDTLRGIEDEELARAKARTKPPERLDLVPGQKVQINNVRDAFHGQVGTYLCSEKKGIATLLIGWWLKEVFEIDLKKVEGPKETSV